MTKPTIPKLRRFPSVDEVLRSTAAAILIERFGRSAVVGAVRHVIAQSRVSEATSVTTEELTGEAAVWLQAKEKPSLRPVFNLTGTVLHTNLGRALYSESAVIAAVSAMRSAVTLEYDLDGGRRGERDNHLRDLLCELTGAEDAIVVNNNAAAVLLALNSLSLRREAIVSRGELIEIGGAFRMPEIMARAGAKLVEVGTTNRTHKKDYVAALGPDTGIIFKVHTSNYRIEGFTKDVSPRELAALATEHQIPLVHDLGSGTLVDLARFGLAHEPTVANAVSDGADLVTFSGDKLLGGPQAGFIVGRKDLIALMSCNPMKRAVRLDKVRIAALEATLKLYRDPERLAVQLPTLRLLASPQIDITERARRMLQVVQASAGPSFSVEVIACRSQIGSGALPAVTLPSAGLAIRPSASRDGGSLLKRLADSLRSLDIPVIGRIEDGALILDLRCIEDEGAFASTISLLDVS